MKWFVLLVLLVACKPKEVPYKPPPKDDAAVKVDAALEIDAAAARTETKAQKVVVGDHVTCALLTDATVHCWGKNSEGQLGIGTTADSAKPVQVKLAGVKDIVIRVKGPGLGRDSAIRALQAIGLEITSIVDVTPVPHNGCRPRKRRRV